MTASATPELWQPLDETLVAFRASCDEFDAQLESSLVETESLRLEFEEKIRELNALRLRMAGKELELQQNRNHSSISTLENQRLEEELEAAQQMIQQLNDELQRQPAGDSDELTLALQTLEQTAQQREATLLELQQDRETLENELELVRSRAAELHATVTEQKQELTGQRQEMGEELKHLRKLVERQAEMLAGGLESSARHDPPAAAATPAKAADPVVNSVMAQFERIQKEAARKRRKR